MEGTRSQRWLGLAGLLFVVLVVVTFPLSPSLSSHANPAKVVSYAHQHKGAYTASGLIVGLAVIEGLFFFWYLRDYLCDLGVSRRLVTIGYAGVVLFAASGALNAGVRLSMADAVDHVDPVVMQGLNVLQQNINFVMGGAGVAVFLLATSVAIVRSRALPPWLGWVGVVLGVVGTVIGAPAAALWVLIVSIVILVRARQVPVDRAGTIHAAVPPTS